MTHRKVRSQGSVPFSWEEKPGISKFSPQNCSKNTAFNPNMSPLQKYFHSHSASVSPSTVAWDTKISPPPCIRHEPQSRSSMMKGLWRQQDDPFAAAMKACTKNIRNYGLGGEEGKTCIGSKGRNRKVSFSCKKSCDVKEDNLVRLPNLPPLPRDRKKYMSKV